MPPLVNCASRSNPTAAIEEPPDSFFLEAVRAVHNQGELAGWCIGNDLNNAAPEYLDWSPIEYRMNSVGAHE